MDRHGKDSLEDGEVEGETETDGVSRGELSHGDVRSGLVSLEGLVSRVLALVTSGELGEVSVVVSHPDEGERRKEKKDKEKKKKRARME